MEQNIGFVKIQNGAFECLVRVENVNKVETALAKVKPPKPGKSEVRQVDSKRFFPQYKPGMSTLEYVRDYERMNSGMSFTSSYIMPGLNDEPAAQYDASVPLCVEDINPDYIPGTDDAPVKAKRVSKQAAYIAELERMVSRLAGFASQYASDSAMLAGGADMVREARALIGAAE